MTVISRKKENVQLFFALLIKVAGSILTKTWHLQLTYYIKVKKLVVELPYDNERVEIKSTFNFNNRIVENQFILIVKRKEIVWWKDFLFKWNKFFGYIHQS